MAGQGFTMKKEITLGQALAIACGLIVSIITGWITITNRVTALENKTNYLEHHNQKLEEKLDAIQKNTVEILIKMERKQDRNP